jgi:putative tryptophan/tyrosine transport system ATP-binding protein
MPIMSRCKTKIAQNFKDITVDGSITPGESITALMVTHSMQQAVDLPDRIIMMHRGQIVEDYRADMKRRVRIPDLIAAFDRVQKRELFDESVANLLAEQYC